MPDFLATAAIALLLVGGLLTIAGLIVVGKPLAIRLLQRLIGRRWTLIDKDD